MRMKRIAPLALALALGAGAASVPQAAWSQAAAPQAQAQPQAPGQAQPRPSRVEGRIAFLRAELRLTEAQAPLFEAVAAAMRDNDRTMRAAVAGHRQRDAASLLDRLERRQKQAEAMAGAASKLRAAWAPLYAALSEEQKKTADQLATEGGRRMGHRRT